MNDIKKAFWNLNGANYIYLYFIRSTTVFGETPTLALVMETVSMLVISWRFDTSR
jgi:hypothetical protein